MDDNDISIFPKLNPLLLLSQVFLRVENWRLSPIAAVMRNGGGGWELSKSDVGCDSLLYILMLIGVVRSGVIYIAKNIPAPLYLLAGSKLLDVDVAALSKSRPSLDLPESDIVGPQYVK